MLKQSKYIYFLLKQLLVVTLLFEICRLFFLLFNLHYFSETAASEIALSFFYGLRFDVCAILIVNGIYVLLFLLPLKLKHQQWILNSRRRHAPPATPQYHTRIWLTKTADEGTRGTVQQMIQRKTGTKTEGGKKRKRGRKKATQGP